MSSKPEVQHLKTLVALVAHAGVLGASRATGVPKSTLSRHLAQLEASVGAPVVDRSRTDFELTSTGRVVHQTAVKVLRTLDEMLANVSSTEPRGLLRISTSYGLFTHALRPMVPAFLEAFPEIDLFIETSAMHRDIFDGSFDLALRGGPFSGDGLIAKRLGKVSLGFYRGTADKGTQVRSRRLIDVAHATDMETQRRPRLTLGEPALIKDMVADGFGAAWLPDYMCRAEVEAGRLTRLADHATRLGPEVFVLYRKSEAQSAKARAFIDFLAEMLVL